MDEHVAQLNPEKDFEPKSMRMKRVGNGVTLHTGRKAGSSDEEPIAYKFDAAQWTPDGAKAWLARRGVKCAEFAACEKKQSMSAGTSAGNLDFEVPVLKAGTFNASQGGTIELTDEDLDQAVRDTNDLIADGSLRPPGKIGHDDDQSKVGKLFPKGGQAALGWFKRFYRSGSEILGSATAVSAQFADAVKRGVWGPRSVELIRDWTHPVTGKVYPLVIKAVAWLGSEMPAVPVHQLYGLSDGLSGSGESLILLLGGGKTGVVQGEIDMTTEELNAIVQAAVKKALDEAKLSAGGGGGNQEAAIKTAVDEALKKATEASEARFKAERAKVIDLRLTAAQAAGKLTPAEVTAQKQLMASMTDEQIDLAFKTIEERKPNPKTGAVGGGHGGEGDQVAAGQDRLTALAAQRAREKKISFAAAAREITAENPNDARVWLFNAGISRVAQRADTVEQALTVEIG